ncbi:hypothetical protein BJ912DRAFT_862749 [Pholiota molesta]|nr:hypothetical protein BJ912DRAFT_862749 [Pholiota molesta]
MPSRSVYKGRRQKLVLAFDVGTSYSGISYSVLDPGKVPEIKGVTRFPAQEQVNGASKIPTIVYYDQSGKIRAVGAEAASEVIYVQAEEEKWVKVEWCVERLQLDQRRHADEIQPLPLNKTVVEVFADFLAYLFKCASSYIQETHANGAVLWASVKDEIDFVLSHPNGWEGTEQSEMRKAAVRGGLIPDTSVGHARLSFVTEGEASLHFAIQNGLPEGAMKNGDGVIIVDAGGGTIDVGSYSRNVSAASKAVFEEMAPPRSHFYGSVFVTIHARQFLQNYLAESPFVDDIDHIVHCFDKTTKQRFIIAEDDQYIKFGSTRDNDAAYNIRFGQLKLLGMDVASFFKPSIDCIINAVMDQKTTSAKPISHVVLVGGFAANNYMFNLVHAALEPDGFNVLRPDSHVSKAVSDGAVSFYLDHFVQSRVSKPTHGNFCSTPSSYPGPTRDKAKEDYNKVCADLQRTQDSLQRTQNDLKTVESDIQELRHTNRDLVQDRVQMQDELKKAKREVEEYRKLLGIKERELLDASQRIDQGREDVFESCVSSTT